MSSQPRTSRDNEQAEALLEDFLVDAGIQNLTDETIRTYKSNLQTAFEFFDDDPRSIGRHELRDLLHYLKNERAGQDGSTGLSESTLNNYFSALNSFYRYLKFEGYLQENPVPEVRERYLEYDRGSPSSERQLISVEEMAALIQGTLNVRNKAIILTLAKTGVRRNELVQMDLEHIDWEEQSIELRESAKRSNTLVFFDGECYRVLERWLEARESTEPTTDALFTNQYGDRLKRNGIYEAVTDAAEAVGLHNPDATDLKDRFTPHCCRHWFTTHLRRSGMDREFIKELRGDTRGDAIDIYDHIDREELREAYLANIPTLGI